MMIRLWAEVTMSEAKKPQQAPGAKKPARGRPAMSLERARFVDQMIVKLKREHHERIAAWLGSSAARPPLL